MTRSAAVLTAVALFGGSGVCVTQAADRPLTVLDANAGKPLYIQECSGCHGERGDGTGPAALFLEPRPRNFTKGVFKLRTTPTGQPPTTDDILRTIERGIPGTAMPSFAFLSSDDRRKIAAHVLRLAQLLDEPEPAPLPAPTAPPATTDAILATGKQLYADAGCVSCHGPLGKGDGTQEMKDSDGRPIKARDFTTGAFAGGGQPVDLYYRFTTGMDGSPMPGFGDSLDEGQRWALVAYVLSLRTTPSPAPLPADPLAAGRTVAGKYSCGGCHVLDDGKGGEVGPDFRLAGQKLDPTWVRSFLRGPHAYGKIYPWRAYRMPQLPLADEEVDTMARYLAAVGHRADAAVPLPDPASFPADKVTAGKNTFVLVCAQCHALGTVVQTPLASQLGPDLARVAGRVDYEWAKRWITNPRQFDAKTRMQIPVALTPDDIDNVRMFVWKTSIEAKQQSTGAAAPVPPAAGGGG
jgi:cytochrome c oxidase cbb3-type subunit 2